MVPIEPRVVAKHDEGKFVVTLPVRPALFAEVLAHLLEGSEAFLGTLTWRRSVKRPQAAALVDKNHVLVSATRLGYDLCIPSWQRLIELELLVFYRDGSVLDARLGSSTKSYRVLNHGDDDEARQRVDLAQGRLKCKPPPAVVISLAWSMLVVAIVFGAAIPLLHLYTRAPNLASPGETLIQLTDAGLWCVLVSCLCLGVDGAIFAHYYYRRATLLPRSGLIMEIRTRFATAWNWLQFNLEDLRRFITAFAAAALIFLLGRFLR